MTTVVSSPENEGAKTTDYVITIGFEAPSVNPDPRDDFGARNEGEPNLTPLDRNPVIPTIEETVEA